MAKTLFIDSTPDIDRVWRKVHGPKDIPIAVNTGPVAAGDVPKTIVGYDTVINDATYFNAATLGQCAGLGKEDVRAGEVDTHLIQDFGRHCCIHFRGTTGASSVRAGAASRRRRWVSRMHYPTRASSNAIAAIRAMPIKRSSFAQLR